MYKKPQVPTFTLKGIDDKLQDLQSIVSNLSWLDYSFGACEHAHREEDEKITVYPAQWINNRTDYVDLRPFPADIYSYAFWDYSDPADVMYNNKETEYSKRQFAHYLYDVACIFVMKIDQIDNSATYNETKSKLRQDIINIFETNLIDINFHFWITAIIEKDIEKIFKGFTIDAPERWIFPNQAFRIEGNVLFKRACPVSNTYTIIT